MFKRASKKQAKLRLALCGVSGSGKTLGALTLAKGMGLDGKIAYIDTERSSASLYSGKDIEGNGPCIFDTCDLEAPYSTQRYVNLIKQAENEGYEMIIVDSLSHAWAGIGGILDIQDKATQASKSKNSYFAWREVTPQHNMLVDTILHCKAHIIVCVRSKTEYNVVSEGSTLKPIKIGLAPIQREGLDYEFDIVLDLSVPENVFSSTKDRTELFKGKYDQLKLIHGKNLVEWLNSGEPELSGEKLLESFINNIKESSSMGELKSIFEKAYDKVKLRPEYLKKITEAKDEKKIELTTLRAA